MTMAKSKCARKTTEMTNVATWSWDFTPAQRKQHVKTLFAALRPLIQQAGSANCIKLSFGLNHPAHTVIMQNMAWAARCMASSMFRVDGWTLVNDGMALMMVKDTFNADLCNNCVKSIAIPSAGYHNAYFVA